MLSVRMPVFVASHMRNRILKTNVNMFCFALGHPGDVANYAGNTLNCNSLASWLSFFPLSVSSNSCLFFWNQQATMESCHI